MRLRRSRGADEFVRKRVPGAATVDISQYVEPRRN
jgi:hypothetical protein